jgi:hypothetical protein
LASPVPASTTVTVCVTRPPRGSTKAMRLPSGDQRGCAAPALSRRTSSRAPEPSAFATKSALFAVGVAGIARVNARRLPSGEYSAVVT